MTGRKRRKRSHKRKSKKSSKSRRSTKVDEEKERKILKEMFPEKSTEENEDIIGPRPLPSVELMGYGSGLLKGEGAAMAEYVQQNKRIPRRGELHSADQISTFEAAGFVMSGSRNKRMTAVRIRKENQVYTAEEQRSLNAARLEEKILKENKIIADFRNIVDSKLAKKQ